MKILIMGIFCLAGASGLVMADEGNRLLEFTIGPEKQVHEAGQAVFVTLYFRNISPQDVTVEYSNDILRASGWMVNGREAFMQIPDRPEQETRIIKAGEEFAIPFQLNQNENNFLEFSDIQAPLSPSGLVNRPGQYAISKSLYLKLGVRNREMESYPFRSNAVVVEVR